MPTHPIVTSKEAETIAGSKVLPVIVTVIIRSTLVSKRLDKQESTPQVES